MIYVHAYPFRPDDPERNVRSIVTSARDKNLKAGDVLIFPFQALNGSVQDFWLTRPENRERNQKWIGKLTESLKNSDVRVILPAVMPQGLGVFSIERGSVRTLDFQWLKGGVSVKAQDCGLDYDLNFKSAAVGEIFTETDSHNLLVIDGQGFVDGKVWLGQCKVVKNGRTRANYMAYPWAFTPEEGPYVLPSSYTSEESFTDARALASNLGLKLRELPIMPAVELLEQTALQYVPYWGNKALMRENLQARVRGILLMAVSNADRSLVLNTGNKSELAVGYCTLYGDMVGGLAPLADVYKSDLYKMCSTVEYLARMIPVNILKKAPTAELRENQKDEDSLPPYPVLDAVLKDLFEGHSDGKKLRKKYGSDLAVKVVKLVKGARFKHNQAPLGVQLSACPVKGLPQAFYEGLLPKQL